MPLDYMVGSARDPNGANRQTRKRIEAAVRRTLRTGGVQALTAVDAASDMVISYLTTANSASLKLVHDVAGKEIARLLEELLQGGVEDRP
ncbi:gamma-glutamylcysteine synthetase [Kribbella aluminosa]|uniref:Gamma-glutamylcysteine synthetase n=1 Tax=Kribbella aluminosa TaxID=416017 RepID=A0ABS4UC15_9ACTN|nr:hypothetical protein [Kribbella aluminosa]MBP2349151.1 gamma-glutamylcysteine synthetase [Kribbella aluminosa]